MTTFDERAPPVRRVYSRAHNLELTLSILARLRLKKQFNCPSFEARPFSTVMPIMAAGNNPIAYNPDKWEELADLIVDIHDMRLKTMDKGTL